MNEFTTQNYSMLKIKSMLCLCICINKINNYMSKKIIKLSYYIIDCLFGVYID